MGASSPTGPVRAPPAGWPAILWVCAPVAGFVPLVGARCLTESAQATSAPLDLAGAVALGSALIPPATFRGRTGPGSA